MKKYRADWRYSVRIKVFEVERETKHTVVYQPDSNSFLRRENKISDGLCWFDSFDEAKAALVAELERKVHLARRDLKSANDRLGNAKGIKDPAEAA